MSEQTVFDLFFRVPLVQNDGVPLPRRSVWNFKGGVVDNPDDETTEIDPSAFMGQVPGDNGQILTSDGAGGYGDPITKSSGDLVTTLSSHTLYNKEISNPIVFGVGRVQGLGGDIYSGASSVPTSSTAAATVASFSMSDETLCAFDVIVTCARQTNVTKGGRYKRSVVYRRTGGGAPAIVGALENGTDQETTAGDNVTIDVSGNVVRVRVTAADADPRMWLCEMRVQETLGVP